MDSWLLCECFHWTTQENDCKWRSSISLSYMLSLFTTSSKLQNSLTVAALKCELAEIKEASSSVSKDLATHTPHTHKHTHINSHFYTYTHLPTEVCKLVERLQLSHSCKHNWPLVTSVIYLFYVWVSFTTCKQFSTKCFSGHLSGRRRK